MIELTQEVVTVVREAEEKDAFAQLADLQLAMVGGGVGTVLWG